MNRIRGTFLIVLIAVFLTAEASLYLRAEDHPNNSIAVPMTAQQIAAKMEEKGRERALALKSFEASRVYHLEYRGLGGNKEAEMKVRMSFRAPASKAFTVISKGGSDFIIEHVFYKLLQGEKEALEDQNREATALTRENYEFSSVAYEVQPDGSHNYVLAVKPRIKNKFLYEGKIWVNDADFAVTRIEAVPAKNPSFWIKKTQIEHRYVKVGEFWLPAQNRSESQIRLGGRALLTIDYDDYRINESVPDEDPERAANSSNDHSATHHARKVSRAIPPRQFGISDAALADALSIVK